MCFETRRQDLVPAGFFTECWNCTNFQKPFQSLMGPTAMGESLKAAADRLVRVLAYKLTSRDLFSYSFMAVMHWCFVLMLVVTPAFTIVSLPVGGWWRKKENIMCKMLKTCSSVLVSVLHFSGSKCLFCPLFPHQVDQFKCSFCSFKKLVVYSVYFILISTVQCVFEVHQKST